MSWIRNLLSGGASTVDELERDTGERFPRDTYAPGYPILLHRAELEELWVLLESERDAPNQWDNSLLLDREDFEDILDESLPQGSELPSPEERRDELQNILQTWEEQLTGSESAVWASIGTEYQLSSYIRRCELRAESDVDEFDECGQLATAREVLDRIETAQDTESKLAIVHKRDLPLEEPAETDSSTE